MTHWYAKRHYRSACFSICFLTRERGCPTEELLAGMAMGDTNASKKTTKYIERLAERGIPHNDENCERLEPDLWELKPFPYRLFFFIRGRDVFFTHGYKKDQRRLDPAQLVRARGMRDDFIYSGQEIP